MDVSQYLQFFTIWLSAAYVRNLQNCSKQIDTYTFTLVFGVFRYFSSTKWSRTVVKVTRAMPVKVLSCNLFSLQPVGLNQASHYMCGSKRLKIIQRIHDIAYILYKEWHQYKIVYLQTNIAIIILYSIKLCFDYHNNSVLIFSSSL